jgi:biopolymer transport protein ExbB
VDPTSNASADETSSEVTEPAAAPATALEAPAADASAAADPATDGPAAAEAVTDGLPEVAAAPLDGLKSLLALMDAGGPVMYVLAVLSVVMVAAVLLKLAQFVRVGVWRRSAAERAVALARGGRTDAAIVVAGSARGIAVRIVLAALCAGRRRDIAAEDIRDEALRMADETTGRLRSGVRLLEVIASLAPLLGLFGTVLGMIEAFQNLEAAGARADPSILSGGIWVALLTTAAGLAVAMPTVVVVNFIDRTVERLADDLDNLVAQLFNREIAGGPAAVISQPEPSHVHAVGQPHPVPAGE